MLFFFKKIRGNHYCHQPLLFAISYTVPFQSIRQVPWRVTHLTKIWFRQPPNFAVTCTKISAVWHRRRRKISILGIWSPNDFVTSPKWPWQSWHFVDFGRPVTRDWRIDWNGTVLDHSFHVQLWSIRSRIHSLEKISLHISCSSSLLMTIW